MITKDVKAIVERIDTLRDDILKMDDLAAFDKAVVFDCTRRMQQILVSNMVLKMHAVAFNVIPPATVESQSGVGEVTGDNLTPQDIAEMKRKNLAKISRPRPIAPPSKVAEPQNIINEDRDQACSD